MRGCEEGTRHHDQNEDTRPFIKGVLEQTKAHYGSLRGSSGESTTCDGHIWKIVFLDIIHS